MTEEREFNKYKELGAYHWRAVQRIGSWYRWHAEHIADMVDKHGDNLDVIDLGGGEGAISYVVNTRGHHPVVVEKEREAVKIGNEKSRGRFRVVQSTIEDFQDIGAKYDIALLIEVLEHVPNPKEILEKGKTLLREGGAIIISTPKNEGETGPDHHKEYSEEELRTLLKNFGEVNIHIPEKYEEHWDKMKPRLYAEVKI